MALWAALSFTKQRVLRPALVRSAVEGANGDGDSDYRSEDRRISSKNLSTERLRESFSTLLEIEGMDRIVPVRAAVRRKGRVLCKLNSDVDRLVGRIRDQGAQTSDGFLKLWREVQTHTAISPLFRVMLRFQACPLPPNSAAASDTVSRQRFEGCNGANFGYQISKTQVCIFNYAGYH